MDHTDLANQYRQTWRTFAQNVSQLSKALVDTIDSEDSTLHGLLKNLQPIPYEEAPALYGGLIPNQPEERRSNIGSVTGLFFEVVAASIVKGYILKHVPEAAIELNRCSVEKITKIARDPDVFIHYQGRHIVFELKTSPKRGDLNTAVKYRKEYEALGDTKYFLIGGHVSINLGYLEYLSNEKWACFTSASEANKSELDKLTLLDDILLEAVEFLLAR